MDENTSQGRKRDSGNAGRCTKTRSKQNCSKKCKFHGKNKTRNPTTATDTDVETVVNKNNHQTSEPSSVITIL